MADIDFLGYQLYRCHRLQLSGISTNVQQEDEATDLSTALIYGTWENMSEREKKQWQESARSTANAANRHERHEQILASKLGAVVQQYFAAFARYKRSQDVAGPTQWLVDVLLGKADPKQTPTAAAIGAAQELSGAWTGSTTINRSYTIEMPPKDSDKFHTWFMERTGGLGGLPVARTW